MKKLISGLFIAGLLAACGSEAFDEDCSHQMDDLRDQSGPPEEIQKYDSGDYHSHTWWYWSRGFSRTFKWGGPLNSCEVSDYTFSPIRSSSAPQ